MLSLSRKYGKDFKFTSICTNNPLSGHFALSLTAPYLKYLECVVTSASQWMLTFRHKSINTEDAVSTPYYSFQLHKFSFYLAKIQSVSGKNKINLKNPTNVTISKWKYSSLNH